MRFPALYLLLCLKASARPPAVEDFVLHPGCVMNLFAAEPDVASPSALCFDADGRCFVTEMLDYPYGVDGKGKPGGRVRMLLDADRDGRAEKSVTFAEGLAFPTSICAVRDGVIVAAPPEIVFLADRDGDGKAEVREVWFTGFVRSVTDSNFNGLRFGPDGLIHGVNGGNGGLIFCPPKKKSCGRLENDDFAFDPVTLEFRRTFPTSGGFGLCFDEAGRSFVTHNINHLQMRILPQRILDEVPGGSSLSGTRNVSVHGENCRIYPVAEAATRPNHPEQAGYFSSAGGVGCLAHRGWPEGLRDSLFICDAASGIVHRELPQPDGPIVKTARAPGEETREFLAGRDPSFRPVGVELGPDGALYIIDMQRDVIEHPDYIPPKMKEKVDIRGGADRGRIWRILPKAGLPVDALPEKDLPAEVKIPANKAPELKLFTSPNQWTRLTEQRLLIEASGKRKDLAAILNQLATHSKEPLQVVHSLWAAHRMGGLEPSTLAVRVNPGSQPNLLVRNAALRIAADAPARHPVTAALWNAAGDEKDLELKWLALVALGETPDRRRENEQLWPLFLAQLDMSGHLADAWVRQAALRLAEEKAASIFHKALARNQKWSPDALRDFARACGSADQLVEIMQVAIPLGDAHVTAVAEGAKKAGIRVKVSADWIDRLNPALLDAALLLSPSAATEEIISFLNSIVANKEVTAPSRARYLRILRHLPFRDGADAVMAALHAGEDPALQQAAMECLREHREMSAAERLVNEWSGIAPALRPQLGSLFIDRREWRPLLAGALESGAIATGELNPDLEQRRTLLRHSGRELGQRFAKFYTDDEYSNRRAVVDEWLAKLPAKGDAAKGRLVFTTHCAQCHKAGGEGHNVGPDLTAQAHRSVEDLLSHILDPDMALNPNYAAMLAETTDGQRHTGILVRSGASIVLRQAMGVEVELPRDRVKSLTSTGHSLMPAGLEAALTPEQLRDLIAFLQSNRPAH